MKTHCCAVTESNAFKASLFSCVAGPAAGYYPKVPNTVCPFFNYAE